MVKRTTYSGHYEQGRAARILRLGKDNNPWPYHSPEWQDWLEGYKDQKRQEYIDAYDGDRSGYYH